MKCRKCGGNTRVIDSRPMDDTIARRRECRECGHRWGTREVDAARITKTCQKCHKTWPMSSRFFSGQRKSADGYQRWCRACEMANNADQRRIAMEQMA